MIIVLEGPDCSGKTTLGQALHKEFNGKFKYIHNSLDRGQLVWRNEDGKIIKKYKDLYHSHIDSLRLHKNAIVDRLWPSELIYGNVFRGGTQYNVAQVKKICEEYKPLYIGCLPPKHLVMKYFQRRLDTEDFSSVDSVYDHYQVIFDLCPEFKIFDYEETSVEKFIKEFKHEHKSSLARYSS